MHVGQARSCHAGLRPRINAQTAALMSANMIMDSDSSSSSDEEEPTPIKRHKGVFVFVQSFSPMSCYSNGLLLCNSN